MYSYSWYDLFFIAPSAKKVVLACRKRLGDVKSVVSPCTRIVCLTHTPLEQVHNVVARVHWILFLFVQSLFSFADRSCLVGIQSVAPAEKKSYVFRTVDPMFIDVSCAKKTNEVCHISCEHRRTETCQIKCFLRRAKVAFVPND